MQPPPPCMVEYYWKPVLHSRISDRGGRQLGLLGTSVWVNLNGSQRVSACGWPKRLGRKASDSIVVLIDTEQDGFIPSILSLVTLLLHLTTCLIDHALGLEQ